MNDGQQGLDCGPPLNAQSSTSMHVAEVEPTGYTAWISIATFPYRTYRKTLHTRRLERSINQNPRSVIDVYEQATR